MALHLCRDYLTQNVTVGSTRTYNESYVIALFLRRVLGYSYVGDTNYPINGVGTLLIATGDSTPTAATPTFNTGTKAGIANNGAFVEVSIPPSVRAVTAADIGRILVLKSPLYPTRNSGLFLITALQTGNNTTITVGSNGQSLPQATINVASTTGFPSSGTIFVTTAAGLQTVTYTGTTGTTFTGCSGGTGAMSTGGAVTNQNKYQIDYRANGDLALVEAVDTVPWYLYEKDANCPARGAGNGGAGYQGTGTSTTPRIILQSPHSTGYQVRICNESTNDTGVNTVNAPITVTPGFGGNSAGDFAIGGPHLHSILFWNLPNITSSADYKIGNGIGDDQGVATGIQFRITMFGDDTGQSFAIFGRRSNTTPSLPRSFVLTFGIPDNEVLITPLDTPIRRLFVLGNGAGDTNNAPASDISFAPGGGNVNLTIQGASFYNSPVSCHPMTLAYVTGNNQLNGPTFEANASDSPWISATELIPYDLMSGAIVNYAHGSNNPALPLYPRIMGQLPLIRNGRANFGEFQLTTDNASWTINAATNASPIQCTTTTTNNLVTGQTVCITGATGNTAANGTWVVTVLNGTQFTLNGSTGNGAFTGTATVLRGASWQHMRRGIYIPWNGPAVIP